MDASHTQPRAARHSRDHVLAAALDLLEHHGLAELTMRRLATELGVQPGALYWHVPNKQSLLAELADRIVDRARFGEVDPGTDWRTAVTSMVRRLRRALLSCRDGAEVVSSSLALGLGGLRAQHELSVALRAGGLEARTGEAVAAILVHQVLGQVWHEQQRLSAEQFGVAVAPTNAPFDQAEQVDLGVALVLAGLETVRGDGPTRLPGAPPRLR